MNKTEFKFFTIADWEEEEEYLSLMHKNGWRLKKIGFMDYHFEKCEPENVTYRLDYNKASVNDKEGYLQMFKDCGWEYIFNKFGYSYFRKKEEPGDKDREIFSDSRSKIEMMERVIKSRGNNPWIAVYYGNFLPGFQPGSSSRRQNGLYCRIFNILFSYGFIHRYVY